MVADIAVEIDRAVALLDKLTKRDPPLLPLGELNPKAIAACHAVFISHTTKVGLVAGYKWGRGLLLVKENAAEPFGAAQWSNPVFYKLNTASLGLLAGKSTVQTLLVLGSTAAVDKFKEGTAIIGQDFTTAAGRDLVGPSADLLEARDSISYSTSAEGVMLDLSIVGGSISLDSEMNGALYGSHATVTEVLAGNAPALPEVGRLHKYLNDIIAAAPADPRRFKGFNRHWHPQSVFDQEGTNTDTLGPAAKGPDTASRAPAGGELELAGAPAAPGGQADLEMGRYQDEARIPLTHAHAQSVAAAPPVVQEMRSTAQQQSLI